MSGPREIYLEITRLSGLVKVTAIDAVDGLEATIFGPANTPEAMLKSAAIKKLEYLRTKNAKL